MNLFDMTVEQLEYELKKSNDLNSEELELFNKGKEFIDKAIDNNYGTEQTQRALLLYAVYRIKKNNIK